MKSMSMKRWMITGTAFALAAAGLTAWYGYALGENAIAPTAGGAPSGSAQAQLVLARGAYLAKAGNCMGCHTATGGAAYAGGRVLQTGFGNFVTPNITPDSETGIGRWSAQDFWNALHNGKSRDGHLLYPAFPYTNYTKVTRSDADALFAFLQSVPAVAQANAQHNLRFPYNQRYLLAFWRAWYFQPGEYVADKSQGEAWNRGAYLVQGLGHCSACHGGRNFLGGGADAEALGGSLMEGQGWFAPALDSGAGLGMAHGSEDSLPTLLKSGSYARGSVSGPMAEVVAQSLQHLDDADVSAMATYLAALPADKHAPDGQAASMAELQPVLNKGAILYKNQCAECHQSKGEGAAGIYPALAGNRHVLEGSPVNALRLVLAGGFAPVTSGNPRPYGMPPFSPKLNDEEVAAVLTYVRNSWGNQASPVTAAQVNALRTVPLE
jgi:mono/diheme cytochrome c family protein